MDQISIESMISSFQNGQWAIGAGFILMVLVMISRKALLVIIPKEYTDLFAAGIGILATIGTGLSVGVNPWVAVISGLTVGATAVGFWELLGKRLQRVMSRKSGDDVDSSSTE